jgi:hypothetical protein
MQTARLVLGPVAAAGGGGGARGTLLFGCVCVCVWGGVIAGV